MLFRATPVLSVIVSIVHLLVAASLASAESVRVRFAYASRNNSSMTEFLAQSKGFFAAEGLEPELIQMNPRLGATALINGDIAFTNAFVSTFRGILQGFPLKLVLVHQRKTAYFLMARPEIKDIQQLKGRKLGVSTVRGTDHIVAEELLLSKGMNPALVQAVGIGESGVRMQALMAGAIDATAVGSPYDLMLRRAGYLALAGPPEVGMPGSGLLTSDRMLRENPQAVKGTVKALLRAHHFILNNKQDTLRILLQWLPQPREVAEHSYEQDLKAIVRDGEMSDAALNEVMNRLGGKKRPLDEVRDFTFARQAMRELEQGK